MESFSDPNKRDTNILSLTDNQITRNLVDRLGYAYVLYEMIYDTDGAPVDFRFLDVNPSFERLTGAGSDRIIGKTVFELFPDMPQCRLTQHAELIKTGETITYEEFFYTRERYFKVSAFSPGPDCVACFIDDVTEYKRDQLRTLKRTEEIERIFENMINAFIIWESVFDSEGNYVSFRFGLFNESFTQISGLNYDDVKGKDVFEVWPETEESWVDVYRKVAETGESNIFEMFHKPTNGWYLCHAYRPTESKEKIAVIFEDITQRKEDEYALSSEKERLAVTLRSIGDGVITTDIDGNITFLNRAAEKITGWSTGEAQGKPLSEVFHIINRITRERAPDPTERIFRLDEIIELESHTSLIAKDGREIVVADSGAPIHNKRSEIIGAVLVFRDMTDKQHLDEFIQKSQKLESMGLLAGGIAHDFNNLLSGMFGYIEMAAGKCSDKEVAGYLAKSLEHMERARSFTKQLITFSKGGNPEQKVAALFPFVEETINFALSGSPVTGRFQIEENLRMCNYDSNQMAQVLENLTINAVQAMPKGGVIDIFARNIHIFENENMILPGGDYIKISIKDSGEGIPREHLSKIFDPYFTTKKKGHGLGLASCYSIVTRHGGILDVESEVGEGSTFIIYLPATRNVDPEILKEKPPQHIGRGTFVVMDDEDSLRVIAKMMLESFGYKVVLTKDGKEAVNFFRKEKAEGRKITGMIFDLTVPGAMGGKEAAAAIRKESEDVPIFVVSGYSSDPILANPGEYGFQGGLCKPFMKSELSDLLEKFLGNPGKGNLK